MTSESGAMPPLAVPVKEVPWVRSPSSLMSIVEKTWGVLEDRMRADNAEEWAIGGARAAYVAGVYAASAAVSTERAHSYELATAAERVDRAR